MTSPAKILIIDDNPSNIKVERRVLELAGYQVIAGEDAAQAFALARAHHPDLMLVDMNLGSDSGMEVCRTIKSNPQLRDIYVVILSATAIESENQAISLEQGADGYIARPISNREFVARVAALLRIKNTEDALREKETQTRALLAQVEQSRRILANLLEDEKRAEETTRQQLLRISALHEIDQAIASTFDMQISLDILLSNATHLLGVDAASVLLVNTTSNTLDYQAGTGFRTDLIRTTRIRFGESYAGKAALERQMMDIPNLARERSNLFEGGFVEKEGFVSYRGVPLIVKGRVLGVLEVFDRSLITRDEQWLNFLQTLSAQAAIAVDNAQLFTAAQRELAERKLAEQKLLDLNLDLEPRIEKRTSDQRALNLQLERAVRIKDEFLANMSHELRTPLNAIIGLSDSLAERIAGDLNEKQAKYVTTISESGQHLLELINDILDLAKIEAGQITLSRDRVSISHVSESALRMVRQLAMKKSQDLQYELDASLDTVSADERRLKQMLVNLLSNAVKFTPEGGKLGLQVQGDSANNTVRFTVWDTGIGIKENDLPRLFQPFVQLDSQLARKAGGTGLGLALVANMAALHGGSVSVESEPGHGSRFTITLPWETSLTGDMVAAITSVKMHIVKPNPGYREHTILLVEDTGDAVLVIRDYLQYAGFKVAVAPNGVEALAACETMTPSLILMDVQMPVMDGLEATRKLRRIPALRHTPIIALTALAMKGDRERCLEAGMNDYISKPVNLKIMTGLILHYLALNTETQSS